MPTPYVAQVFMKRGVHSLFMNAYTLRGAGAVIHSHSKAAVLATLLYPGPEFCITHQEMIKGIKKGRTGVSYRYDEQLVPIIENVPFEKDLKDSMKEAMEQYPDTCAVLVRRHGVYVWGDTWERAKTMCECYDYLFDIAVQMKQLGLDPTVPGSVPLVAQEEPRTDQPEAIPVGSVPPDPSLVVTTDEQPTTLAEAVQAATGAEETAVPTLSAINGNIVEMPDTSFPVTLDKGSCVTEGQTTYVVYM
uniref:Putative methylthioribulose 1 phosphate dehydratase n=1 Tax=Alectorobius mimon TaxID=360319 RepID=A0A147B7G7_9ACAR